MEWYVETHRDIPFAELEKRQNEIRAQLKQKAGSGFFLLSEPRPVYTSGRAADPEGLLGTVNIETHPVSRGGQWTYHGPGQLVLYPLLRLKDLHYDSKSAAAFIGDMRWAVTTYLDTLGITADPPNPDSPYGVYVNGAKICSFGIAIEEGVSAHGLALYLEDQTFHFSGIHPCGIPGARVTSLAQLGHFVPWEVAARQLTELLKNRFTRPKTC